MAKILVLVPHGDDEALGFGGSIVKHVEAGDEVIVTTVRGDETPRYATQHSDTFKAKDILKYSQLHQLNLKEKDIYNNPYDLKCLVEAHLLNVNPDTLYTTFISDNHQDHKSLFNAITIATRPWGEASNLRSVYVGEIFSSSDQSFSFIRNKFVPNFYNILTEAQLNLKIQAAQAYSQEYMQSPHPRSEEIIRSYARIRGSECRSKYAEALMLLRHYNH